MPLPAALLDSIQDTKGFDSKAFLDIHESGEQVISIRTNPFKHVSQPNERSALSMITESVPWCSNGHYLSHRPSFTFDPLFHAGCYYVQEASSMFLETALRQCCNLEEKLNVLDLCAAPGGKSTLIQSIISPESVLVSNEVIKSRATILEENISKWGAPNVIVTNNDPKDFGRLENVFDVIVVDAPCSGSGLFRRDPEAIEEWSEQNVALCSQRQQRILADVWPALKEEGILIYSTCSYSKEEDEDIIDWICTSLEVEPIRLTINDSWNIVETIAGKSGGFGYRFWPDKVKGEGFFITCFRKKDGGSFNHKPGRKSSFEKLTRAEEQILKPWLLETVPLRFVKQGDGILAIPLSMEQMLEVLTNSKLYVRQAGIRIGKFAGSELVPDHALSVSTIINPSLVAVTLKYEAAIQYLRRDEVEIAGGRGWTIAQFNGVNLGWVKILSNRINNYYPKEWRILKKME